MLYKAIAKKKPEPIILYRSVFTPLGVVNVYKMGADLYLECPQFHSGLASHFDKVCIPMVYKSLGLDVPRPDTTKRDIRIRKKQPTKKED